MVALVNIVKMPDSQICLAMQVTVNALKSVNIETLQGFFFISVILVKSFNIFCAWGSERPTSHSGSDPGQGNYNNNALSGHTDGFRGGLDTKTDPVRATLGPTQNLSKERYFFVVGLEV